MNAQLKTMKTITLTLLLLVAAISAQCAAIRDAANLFGPDANRIVTELGDKPVWIETMTQKPADLKAYADSRLAGVTTNGFIIVITTQPRAWRISMVPIGLAASPKVEAVGQRMAEAFKKGKVVDGIIAASNELTALTKASSGFNWMLWICVGVGVAVVSIIIALTVRAITERREEEARAEREERHAQRKKSEQELDSRPEGVSRKTYRKYSGHSRDERSEATRIYVNHPQYSPGILDDPIRFMMFMQLMDISSTQHQIRDQLGARYSAPVASDPPSYSARSSRRDPDPEPSSSYDSGGSGGGWSSSSSYDSGSSSSYDSGGSSSFDSGSSSCDGSGSGGSW